MEKVSWLIPILIVAFIEHVQGDPVEGLLWMVPTGYVIASFSRAAGEHIDRVGRLEDVDAGNKVWIVPIAIVQVVWGFYMFWAMWSAYHG